MRTRSAPCRPAGAISFAMRCSPRPRALTPLLRRKRGPGRPEHPRACPSKRTSLGQPVAARGYGSPSQVRAEPAAPRRVPGLTQVGAGVGVVLPAAGRSSESSRRAACTSSATTRAGGTSIRSKHRLMVDGLVKRGASVYTMDDLMRLPAGLAHPLHRVRREQRAWSGATSPCRRVQYTHGMLSCSRIHRRQALDPARRCAASTEERPATCWPRAPTAPSHDAHRLPMDQRARRRDRRVGHERRDAAARERLSAAPRRARDPGRVLGEVPAPPQGRRPALRHQGRGRALRRPHARRHAAPVHLDPGMQVGDHARRRAARPCSTRASTTSPGSPGRAAAA